MADYFAVLQRTLSGFSEPKPELRIKLYERARSTIERQLAGRNPPVTGEALDVELKLLEQAIVDIERQYDPTFEAIETAARSEPEPASKPEPVAAPAAKAEPAAKPETAAESAAKAEPTAKPEPTAAPAAKEEPAPKPEPAAAPAAKEEPAPKPEPAAAPAAKAEPAAKPEPAAAPAAKTEPAAKPEPTAAPAAKEEPAPKPEPAAAPAAKEEPAPKPEPAAAPAAKAEPAAKPEPAAAPAAKTEPAAKPEATAAPAPKPEPAPAPKPEPVAPVAKPEPVSEPAAKAEPAAKPEPAAAPAAKVEPAAKPEPAAAPVAKEEPAPKLEPEPEPKPEPAAAPPIPIFEPPVPEPVVQAPVPAMEPTVPAEQEAPSANPAVDPVEEWAKEFLAIEPAQTPAPQPAPVSIDENVAAADDVVQQSANETQIFDHGSPLVPQMSEPSPVATEIPAAHDLPAFDSNADPSLGIPPAPGFSPKAPRRSKKRRGLKWLLVIILLAAIAAAGYFGWQSRATLIDTFGLNKWFVDPQDPQTPKKVKTIIIKPDPVESETDPVDSTKSKSETRLPAEGTATATDKVEIKPVPANGAPPVSQSAVLYEEGATAADSSIDRGRVVWSVVQKAPVEGLPAEPAIQGRVEVPSRSLVLNMTIKRNADKSLPASHVIELNFTVPPDFSGGAVGQIRSLVFKNSEQGQGKALIGVPVQLTEGQFILALNNLESAQKSNVELIESSGWIDVPILYRTGRRAFITIEKGAPGEKVFEEVLAAWAP